MDHAEGVTMRCRKLFTTLVGLAVCAASVRATESGAESRRDFYRSLQWETDPDHPRLYRTAVLARTIDVWDGWRFTLRSRDTISLLSPDGIMTCWTGDPHLFQGSVLTPYQKAHYGDHRRSNEWYWLDEKLAMLIKATGGNKDNAWGFVEEVVFLSPRGALTIRNVHDNNGQAQGHRSADAWFVCAEQQKHFLQDHKDHLYWNGQHFVDHQGQAPNPPPWAEKMTTRRSSLAVCFDRRPCDADHSWLLDASSVQRSGVTEEDRSLAVLYRQARAGLTDPDEGVRRRAWQRVRDLEGQIAQQIVALERSIRADRFLPWILTRT
jgi:hypothetical protein